MEYLSKYGPFSLIPMYRPRPVQGEFQLRHEEAAGARVIALAGDADRFRTDEVSAAIAAARKDGVDILIDVSDVAVIDPAMLALFVSASEVAARHGESLVIVTGGPRFRRTLQIKGLESLLQVADSRDEAFASLRR